MSFHANEQPKKRNNFRMKIIIDSGVKYSVLEKIYKVKKNWKFSTIIFLSIIGLSRYPIIFNFSNLQFL